MTDEQIERQATSSEMEHRMTHCARCGLGIHQVFGLMPTSRGLVCNVCVERAMSGFAMVGRPGDQRPNRRRTANGAH